MSEQFTQGPWQRGAGATVITQPKAIEDDFKTWIWEYWPICDASIGQKSREEKEANAALIAAAPEMYEALKKLKVCIEDYFGKTEREFLKCCDKDVDVFFIQPYMAACNALKKARGEE